MIRGSKKTIVTRRGKLAATEICAAGEKSKNFNQVIARMKALRNGNVLGKGLSIRRLIEEGRRF